MSAPNDVIGVKWLKKHNNVYLCGPDALKTPSYSHRLYDLQDILDKLMIPLPQPSDFVLLLKNGLYCFRAEIDCHHPVDPGASYNTSRTMVLRRDPSHGRGCSCWIN